MRSFYINVGWRKILVRFVDMSETKDSGAWLPHARDGHGLILIDKGLPKYMARDVFMHELTHVIMDSLDLPSDETAVNGVSSAYIQALRGNIHFPWESKKKAAKK